VKRSSSRAGTDVAHGGLRVGSRDGARDLRNGRWIVNPAPCTQAERETSSAAAGARIALASAPVARKAKQRSWRFTAGQRPKPSARPSRTEERERDGIPTARGLGFQVPVASLGNGGTSVRRQRVLQGLGRASDVPRPRDSFVSRLKQANHVRLGRHLLKRKAEEILGAGDQGPRDKVIIRRREFSVGTGPTTSAPRATT